MIYNNAASQSLYILGSILVPSRYCAVYFVSAFVPVAAFILTRQLAGSAGFIEDLFLDITPARSRLFVRSLESEIRHWIGSAWC